MLLSVNQAFATGTIWSKLTSKKKSSEKTVSSKPVKKERKKSSFWKKLVKKKSKKSSEDKSVLKKEENEIENELFRAKRDEEDDEDEPVFSVEPSAETRALDPESADMIEQISSERSLQKQELYERGEQAFRAGMEQFGQQRFEQALEFFRESLRLRPGHKKTLNYIERVNHILGRDIFSAKTLSSQVEENRSVSQQELVFATHHHLEMGKEAVNKANDIWNSGSEGRHQALAFLSEARLEFTKSMDSLNRLGVRKTKEASETELKEMIKGVDALKASWDEALQEEIKLKAIKRAEEIDKEQVDYKKEQVRKIRAQTKLEYSRRNYDKSAVLAKVLLSMAPKDREAKKLLLKSEKKRDQALELEIRKKSEEEWRRYEEKIKETLVNYSDILVYPDHWERINKRQSVGRGTDDVAEWEKKLRKSLQQRISLFLEDSNLQQAIDRILDQTQGINFSIDRSLIEDLEDARFSFKINDSRLVNLLELLLRKVPLDTRLVYDLRNGGIFITSRENENLLKQTKRIMYDVTDLTKVYQEAVVPEGSGLNTGGAAGSAGLTGVDGSNLEEAASLDLDSLQEIIQTTIEPESWENEAAMITIYQGKFLITQTPEVHREIDRFLDLLRKQQKIQIAVEARFISSEDDDLFELGVEWRGLSEVQLEDSITSTSPGAGAYSSRDTTDSDTRVASLLGSAGDITTVGQDAFITDNRAGEGLLAEIAILDPIRAGLALHALDRKRTIHNILAPRLTVLNNHQGYIIRAQDTSYISGLDIEDGNVIPEVDRISSGEILVVRPTVSSDMKYVTMDLSPQITRNIELEQRAITILLDDNGGGNNGGGGVNVGEINLFAGTIELPNLEVWQVQTRVQVPDGGVVFVGGRMGATERTGTRAVPILGKLPIFGRLFRSDSDFSGLENLIISVRTRILLFEELEQERQ